MFNKMWLITVGLPEQASIMPPQSYQKQTKMGPKKKKNSLGLSYDKHINICVQRYKGKELQHLLGLFTEWRERTLSQVQRLVLQASLSLSHCDFPRADTHTDKETESAGETQEIAPWPDYGWLAAKPIQVPQHRTACPSGKVLAFQRERWDDLQIAKTGNTASSLPSKVLGELRGSKKSILTKGD